VGELTTEHVVTVEGLHLFNSDHECWLLHNIGFLVDDNFDLLYIDALLAAVVIYLILAVRD
jgi:hypothetical protein